MRRGNLIGLQGKRGNLGWTPSLRKIPVFVLERDTRTKVSESTETLATNKPYPKLTRVQNIDKILDVRFIVLPSGWRCAGGLAGTCPLRAG